MYNAQMMPMREYNNKKITDSAKEHRINFEIRCLKVLLVDENDEKQGVVFTKEALERANLKGLDLVEVAPNAQPPVCKLMDYGKFIYEQKKRDKQLKAKSTQIVVKEIRFGPQTDEHDYEFKRKNAEKFLKEGSKLKAFVFFVLTK